MPSNPASNSRCAAVTTRAAAATPAPAPAAPTRGPVGSPEGGARRYVGEARLGGTRLRLDFIVYRRRAPFAEINGLDVHVGESVEGYTVVAIAPEEVTLEGPAGRVVLAVR